MGDHAGTDVSLSAALLEDDGDYSADPLGGGGSSSSSLHPEGHHTLPVGELVLDEMSPEDMQRQIAEIEAAIATAEKESAEAQALQDEEPDIQRVNDELARLDAEIEKVVGGSGIISGRSATAEGGEGGETESNSVYIGNVDWSATPEELQRHFTQCGPIERCNIMINKTTGTPMGYAYIEFKREESAMEALALNDSLFRGRQIKVSIKRVNVPFHAGSRRVARGRAGAGGFPLRSPSRRPSFGSPPRRSFGGYTPFPRYSPYTPRRPRRGFGGGFPPRRSYGSYYY